MLLQERVFGEFTLSNVSKCKGFRAAGPTIKTPQSALVRSCILDDNNLYSCLVYFKGKFAETYQCSFVNNDQTKITDVDLGMMVSQGSCEVFVINCDFINKSWHKFFRLDKSSVVAPCCYFKNCSYYSTGPMITISDSKSERNELPFKFIQNNECAFKPSCIYKDVRRALLISIYSFIFSG